MLTVWWFYHMHFDLISMHFKYILHYFSIAPLLTFISIIVWIAYISRRNIEHVNKEKKKIDLFEYINLFDDFLIVKTFKRSFKVHYGQYGCEAIKIIFISVCISANMNWFSFFFPQFFHMLHKFFNSNR